MIPPSASQLLHAHLGAPQVDGCGAVAGPAQPCWVCAGPAIRALPRAPWAGASYTGQTKVRAPASPWVCEACIYVHSRIAPVPGRPPAPGKTLGGNFRNYSHLYEELPGGEVIYLNASKGEKPAILAFLRGPKAGRWWAAIADSGQKHVISWAPINAGGARGRVLFDDTLVALPDAAGWVIVDDLRALLTVGATKDEVSRGDYGPGAWIRCRSAIDAFEARWARGRHSAWFTLALWLAQRDEEAVEIRQAAERAAAVEKKAQSRRGGNR